MNLVFAQVPAFKQSRLKSLFGEFSHLKEQNPEGYEANVQAWLALLRQCLSSHTFDSTVTLPTAQLALKLVSPDHGPPKLLALVLERLVQDGLWVPLSIYTAAAVKPVPTSLLTDYLSPRKLISRSWASLRLLRYTLRADLAGLLREDTLIHWDTLVAVADSLWPHLKASIDSQGTYLATLMDEEHFRNIVQQHQKQLSPSDLEALLVYYSRDCGKLQVERATQVCIKVGSAPLTDTDKGIIDVNSSIRNLERRTATLEKVLDHEIADRLKQLVASKASKERLKTVLVRKRQIADSLSKTLATLSNLQLIMEKINEAQTNLTIAESLASASLVLTKLNLQVSFDAVDNVCQQIEEQIETTDEITNALNSLSALDATDVDEELKALEAEYEQKNTKAEVEESNDDLATGKLLDRLANISIADDRTPRTTTPEKAPEKPEPQAA